MKPNGKCKLKSQSWEYISTTTNIDRYLIVPFGIYNLLERAQSAAPTLEPSFAILICNLRSPFDPS